MMKKLSYILLVIVFFNIMIFSLYYLRIINHYSLVIFNDSIDVLITNLILFFIMLVYSVFYQRFMIKKFNYFKVASLGLIIGIIFCLFFSNLIFEEYLFIALYTSFSFTFISYSVYFDLIKDKVFK